MTQMESLHFGFILGEQQEPTKEVLDLILSGLNQVIAVEPVEPEGKWDDMGTYYEDVIIEQQ